MDSSVNSYAMKWKYLTTETKNPVGVAVGDGSTDYCVMSYESNYADQYTEFCFSAPSHLYEVRDESDDL